MGTSVFSRRALLTAASAASGSWVLSACGSQEPQTSGNTSATASTTPSATGTTSPASVSSSPTATPKVTKSSTPSNPTIKPSASPTANEKTPETKPSEKLTQRPRPQSLHIPKTRSRNQKAALQKDLPRPRAKNLLSTHRSSRIRNRYGASSIKLAHSHRKIGPRRIWCRFMDSSYVLRRLRRHSL